jgi:tetratricopeptide (TPR) repeat protein
MRALRRTFICFALVGTFVIDTPHCSDVDHGRRAIYYLQEAKFERALTAVGRALRQRLDDPQLHLIAGLAHLGLEDIESGVEALSRALVLDPDNVELYDVLRDACLRQERFDLARDAFASLRHHHPGHSHILAHLGWAHLHLEEIDLATELFEAAIAADSVASFAHVQLSRLYLQQKRFDEAVAVLKNALEIAPNNQHLLVVLGESQLQQGGLEAAERSFVSALEKSSDPPLTAVHIARTYYKYDMRFMTIHYYEEALARGDSTALVLNNLAWTYAEEGIELERATDLSYLAIKHESDNVVYLDTLAELLYQKGRIAHAIALMQHCLELESEDGQHYAYLQKQLQKFQHHPTSSVRM